MEPRDMLPQAEILAQLAEEAAELAQAALKLRRALDGHNPTLLSVPTAKHGLSEEIADVRVCLGQLDINEGEIKAIEAQKHLRWIVRLEAARAEMEE